MITKLMKENDELKVIILSTIFRKLFSPNYFIVIEKLCQTYG